MSEQTTATPAAEVAEHPLKDFKPTTKTIWHHQAERAGHCEVHSLAPPPQEINLRESCGRQHVKGIDPQYAAQVYRETRKLSEDWPVEVEVFLRQEDGTFTSDGKSVLPAPVTETPATETTEMSDEPKAPEPAEAALDVEGQTEATDKPTEVNTAPATNA